MPLGAPAARPLRALRITASAALVALIFLCLAWELWLPPLRPGGAHLALQALPPARPRSGLFAGRGHTLQWSSPRIPAYVAQGGTPAVGDFGPSPKLILL